MFGPSTSNQSIKLDSYIDLIESCSAQKNYELALEFAKEALQLQPRSPEILLLMGRIYVKQERYKEALPYLEQLNKLWPLDPKEDDFEDGLMEKEYLLGMAYYALAKSKEDYLKAVRCLSGSVIDMLNVPPRFDGVLLLISKICMKLELYKEAKFYSEQLNMFEPTNPEKDYLLGRASYQLASSNYHYEKAARYLSRAAKAFIDEKDSVYAFYAGLAHTFAAETDRVRSSGMQHYDMAIACFELALDKAVFEKPSQEVAAHIYSAQAHYGLGQYKESLREMARARNKMDVTSEPALESAWKHVSDLLMKKGYSKEIAYISQPDKVLENLKNQLKQIEITRQKENAHIHRLANEMTTLNQQIKTKEETIQKNNQQIEKAVQKNKGTLNTLEKSIQSFKLSVNTLFSPSSRNASHNQSESSVSNLAPSAPPMDERYYSSLY